MNTKELILKLTVYKMIPLMATWLIAFGLIKFKHLIRTDTGSSYYISINIWAVLILLIAAYITKRCLDYYVEEKPSSRST